MTYFVANLAFVFKIIMQKSYNNKFWKCMWFLTYFMCILRKFYPQNVLLYLYSESSTFWDIMTETKFWQHCCFSKWWTKKDHFVSLFQTLTEYLTALNKSFCNFIILFVWNAKWSIFWTMMSLSKCILYKEVVTITSKLVIYFKWNHRLRNQL